MRGPKRTIGFFISLLALGGLVVWLVSPKPVDTSDLFMMLDQNRSNLVEELTRSSNWKSVEFGSCGILVNEDQGAVAYLNYMSPDGLLREEQYSVNAVEHGLGRLQSILSDLAKFNPNCDQLEMVVDKGRDYQLIVMKLTSDLAIQDITQKRVPKSE